MTESCRRRRTRRRETGTGRRLPINPAAASASCWWPRRSGLEGPHPLPGAPSGCEGTPDERRPTRPPSAAVLLPKGPKSPQTPPSSGSDRRRLASIHQRFRSSNPCRRPDCQVTVVALGRHQRPNDVATPIILLVSNAARCFRIEAEHVAKSRYRRAWAPGPEARAPDQVSLAPHRDSGVGCAQTPSPNHRSYDFAR